MVFLLLSVLEREPEERDEWGEVRHREMIPRTARRAQAIAVLIEGDGELPPVTLEDVDQALEAVEDYMNRIEVHFTESAVSYRHATTIKGTDHLIWAIRRGMFFKFGNTAVARIPMGMMWPK